jgi:hypothetical protein
MIVDLSVRMALVVPLLVVAPDSTKAAKPTTKVRAKAAMRRCRNESLFNTRTLLPITARLVGQG